MDYKQLMIDRLERRKQQFLVDYERAMRKVLRGKIGGEENRLWVEEQIKGLALGVDIACGDMVTGEHSEGVDTAIRTVGPVWYVSGDALINWDDNSLDYVVTNYIEAFVDTFKAIREWHRVLKPGGVLAFSCANADNYVDPLGPFVNAKRNNVFTKRTILNYLTKAKFVNAHIEDGEENSMRVRCNKSTSLV